MAGLVRCNAREAWALVGETMQGLLDSDGDVSALVDRERLLGALERLRAHRAASPDRIDRRVMNQRLRQYARGEREDLFCEIIGA